MKFLKYLLFLLLIILIGLAIYIAVQPNSFNVKRERVIDAPASVVYQNVIDFKKWPNWSPWIEREPDLTLNFPEQTSDVGASYSWEGKDGTGNMKTVGTILNESIDQKLQFEDYEPSDILWKFEPTPDGKTNVIWEMKSEKIPFMFKGYAAFSGGFDKMIGPDFERGLELLDSVSVADTKKYSIEIQGVTEHGGGFYLYNTTSTKIADIESKMGEFMGRLFAYAQSNNIVMAGAPFANYISWDEKNGTTTFSCCYPTTDKVITTSDEILTGQLEPFKAVKTVLKGNYENLKEAWDKAMAYIPANGLEFAENGPMLEVYLTDPSQEPNPANWITEIYIAVK